MDLRPELLPPPVRPERLDALSRHADRIVGLLDRGEPAEAEIAAFNAATGGAFERADFLTYPGAEDAQDFVRRALRPERPRVPDVTRDELAEIVRRIQAADPDTDYYVLLFDANTPRPGATDLIFWPPEDLRDATPEEIVDAALDYRPFATGSGDTA